MNDAGGRPTKVDPTPYAEKTESSKNRGEKREVKKRGDQVATSSDDALTQRKGARSAGGSPKASGNY